MPRSFEQEFLRVARSVGMTGLQCMWHVVLPQAVKLMIPPMGGVYVIIIKGTSIVSVIRIAELVRVGEHAALRHPGSGFV